MRRRTALVTGATSGIGKATAIFLASKNIHVFAGYRKSHGANAICTYPHAHQMTPIQLDVTSGDDVESAATAVREQTGGLLHFLVNNAGIGMSAPMETVDLAIVRKAFEVNLFGQLAVTQAFLPMLRASCGRIVNICSVGAHFTVPFGGVLCGCKSALESFSDALRLELYPLGVRVCMIEPGSIQTSAIEKTLGNPEGQVMTWPTFARRLYGDAFVRFSVRAAKREEHGSPPSRVAETVYRALTARSPQARYTSGKHSRLLTSLAWLLPDSALDRFRRRVFALPSHFGREGRCG